MGFQTEIQGLRAVAVLAVLIFHVWPSALPGGYVGVDVFLVISGYLITGLLLREAERSSGRISLANFYTRRVRRLLPAAVLVIAVSCMFVWVLPRVQWVDTAREAFASTFYVQNWWLAHQAVNYLAEDTAPGLLRHYWSLSVEEQYYIFWPLMYGLAARCAQSVHRQPRRTFLTMALVTGALSLLYSVHLTAHNPGLAYFSTGTRAWELALGSALAVWAARLQALAVALRMAMGWLGLGAILAACFVMSTSTAFPGYAALLPTLGAALVIAAGNVPQVWGANRLLSLRPMIWIGDISYSLYLWHWPILIVTAALLHHSERPEWHHGVLMIGGSIMLAHLSKHWVEDPFRHGAWRRWPAINSPLVIVAASVVLVCLAAGTIVVSSGWRNSRMAAFSQELLHGAYDPRLPTVPPLVEARDDNPDVYDLECHVDQRSSEPKHCSFGPASAQRTMALVGDSHAAQWLPTLQEVFRNQPEWRILTYTKSACSFNATTVTLDGKPYESCSKWNERLVDELQRQRPEVVMIGASATYEVPGLTDEDAVVKALADGLLIRWEQLLQMGARVVVLRDTPRMGRNIPECMSAPGATVETCSVPLVEARRADPIVLAVERAPQEWQNLALLDFTDQICDGVICKPVKGQVLIWRDGHHFTATFARSLSEKMSSMLVDHEVLRGDGR